MTTPVLQVPESKSSPLRYLSCLRPRDVVVLQGSPLLGAAFAISHPDGNTFVLLAILLAANVFLVSHIFMINDWSGLTTDLADPNKSARVFTARGVGRREMVAVTVGFLVLSLLLFALLGAMTLVLALAIATLSALYSLPWFDWKAKPLLNSLAHLAGGTLHFLLGYSVGGAVDQRGIAIGTFFALVFVAGHLTQEVRDHRADAVNAIRTNAVAFGPRRTFAASLALFTLAHAVLLLLALQGVLPRPLAAVVVLYLVQLYWSRETLREGLSYASVSRLQTRYRVLYAIIGLAMIGALLASSMTNVRV